MNCGICFGKAGRPVVILCAGLVAILTGCASHADRPAQGDVYVEPPPIGSTFMAQDEYVYYPTYQVYYSNNRHQYAYREGSTWVARTAPPGVPVAVLQASPSVRMDFHDSPELHDAAMAQRYPKNWSAPGSNQGQNTNPKYYPPHNGK